MAEKLSHNVKVLGAVSLAQDTGSEMLYPLLPTFITRVLGAPVVAVGVAEGLADAVAAGMKLVAGKLAGSQRRRRWIAAGYALATVGKLIVALSFVWPVVLLGRTVDRIGKGVRGVPRDALIADDTPPALRGRAFGFHRSLDTTGAVLGPLIGLALLELLGGRIRPALFVAIVPAGISVALVGLVRRPPPPRRRDDAEHGDAEHGGAEHGGAEHGDAAPVAEPVADAAAARRLPPTFWRVLAPLAAFALVNSTDALLLQRCAELGLSVTRVVVAYILYNAVYAALGYPAGKLADRVPPRLVFAAGLVVFAVVYIGLGTITTAAGVWLLLPCYGVYTALTDGVSRAWIANLIGSEQRTWALGVHGAVTGVGVLLAGLWSGLAWHGTGRVPLVVSGVAAAVIATWVVAIGPRGSSAPAPAAPRPAR